MISNIKIRKKPIDYVTTDTLIIALNYMDIEVNPVIVD